MDIKVVGRVHFQLKTKKSTWHTVSDLAIIDGKNCAVLDWDLDGSPIGIIPLEDQWLIEMKGGEVTHLYQWPVDDPRNLQ